MKKAHLILVLILCFASKGGQAQNKSAYCLWNNGTYRTTPIFAASDSLEPGVLYEGEPANPSLSSQNHFTVPERKSRVWCSTLVKRRSTPGIYNEQWVAMVVVLCQR